MDNIRRHEPSAPHFRIPIRGNDEVFIIAYPGDEAVKIKFRSGGFIWAETFRRAYHNARTGMVSNDGPVRIETTVTPPLVEMEIAFVTREQTIVTENLTGRTCDRIMRALLHIDTMLDIFLFEDEVPVRRPSLRSGVRLIRQKTEAA